MPTSSLMQLRRGATSRPQPSSSPLTSSNFVFSVSGENQISLSTELAQLVPYRSSFQKVLLCENFNDSIDAFAVQPMELEQMLLEPEAGLFESLISSVLGVDNSQGGMQGGICGLSAASESKMLTFTIDSGSTVHILTLAAAQQLLHAKEPSRLQVVGVSGKSTRADVCGHLLTCVRDSALDSKNVNYVIDLGIAHGMRDCPLNILSVALLMKAGAVMHFEEGACYFKPFREAPKIPFEQLEPGLFQIKGEDAHALPGSLIETSPTQTTELISLSSPDALGTDSDIKCKHSYSVNGHVFATSADLNLWHRRLGHHLPKSKLVQIFKNNLVDGFKVRGRLNTNSALVELAHRPKFSANQFSTSGQWTARLMSSATLFPRTRKKFLTKPSEVLGIVSIL